MTKEVRQLLKELRKQGFTIEESGRHFKAFPPGGGPMTVIPRTPSDPRSLKNAIALLRKRGFLWKGR